MLDPTMPAGAIAAQHPIATRVFHAHDIEFCCGGGRPLQDACMRRGLDTDAIVVEIEELLAGDSSTPVLWTEAPLEDLVEHILVTYHRPLDHELPRLEQMARKVARVHGDKQPDVVPEVLSLFLALKSDLEAHMQKEEEILFPMILDGDGALAEDPIHLLEGEHDEAGRTLRRLRQITQDYRLHPEACGTWRALWHGLELLERDLHEHIHLENNVLHPRALGEG